MKKLKQALSLTLALVLSLALAAPAFAADYQEMTINLDAYGSAITFSAAKLGEPVTRPYVNMDEEENISLTPLILQPGSQVTKAAGTDEECGYILAFERNGEAISFTGIALGVVDGGAEEVLAQAREYIKWSVSGAWDEADCMPVIQEDNGTSYWLQLGDNSSAAPAQPTVTIPEGSVAYTVQKGDTLGFIATNFYGNNAQRNALYQANIEAFRATKGALKPGMVLAIPATLNKAVRIAAPVAGEGEKLYTVKAGDTLGQIAAAEYGNANAYKAIFERNSDRLTNANTIYEGQVIVLPAKK